MKKTLLCAVAALAALSLFQPADAAIFGNRGRVVSRSTVVVRQQPVRVVQQRVVQRQVVQQVVHPAVVQQVIAQPVYAVPAQVVAPVVQQQVTTGCQTFFAR